MQRFKLFSVALAAGAFACAQTSGPASVFGPGLASQLAIADTITVSVQSYALPQLVFGGGWYTAIYFNNRTSDPQTVGVFLFDANGQPLVNPSLGGSSTSVALAGQGTAIVEFPDVGSLQQGWARVDVPDGVVGYGVFRNIVPGQPPRLYEGVIPFASTLTTFSSMIFDDTSYDTAVAIANPSPVTASIQITALDTAGQMIGAITQTLGPNARTAVVLHDVLPVRGKRGSITFVANTGALSVLGLRFNSSAFTSIPPSQ